MPEALELAETSSPQQLEQAVGEDVFSCYQCLKCSSGCPVAYAMDYLPYTLLHNEEQGLSQAPRAWSPDDAARQGQALTGQDTRPERGEGYLRGSEEERGKLKVSYYPGCSLEGTAQEFDESLRAVCQALD